MADKEQKPPLQELSKRMLNIYEDLIKLYQYLDKHQKLTEDDSKIIGELKSMTAELLCKVYEAKGIAVKTLNPFILAGHPQNEADALAPLDFAEDILENLLPILFYPDVKDSLPPEEDDEGNEIPLVDFKYSYRGFINSYLPERDGIVNNGNVNIWSTCCYLKISVDRIAGLSIEDLEITQKQENDYTKPQTDIITIDASKFNRNKTYQLLEKIIQDTERKGVACLSKRTFDSLKANLKNHRCYDVAYDDVAKSLTYENGKVKTSIGVGLITIRPKA